LFEASPALPDGLRYAAAFLTSPQEAELLEHIGALALQEARYKQYTARRRTASFGAGYDFDRNAVQAAPPIPKFLLPLRERIAQWVGIDPAAFAHALVTEYRPGTPLGWHRDVPDFGIVVGVSLLGWCRMRFRPYARGGGAGKPFALELAPRSAYALQGEARWGWQHAVSPTKALRYSITFRTMRERKPSPSRGG
jgi:alkylated DNA repair dioxygenase AlkB